MITLDDLTLPDELVWLDEFAWTPVAQTEDYSLAGAFLVQQGVKLAGRPLTLGRNQGEVWAKRSLILSLQAKAATTDQMTLTLHDGRSFHVIWRVGDGPIEATQVVEYNYPPAAAWYNLTLRFLIVGRVGED